MYIKHLLILTLLLFSLPGCENMKAVGDTFKSINEVLSPLVILKQGSS